MPQFVMSENEFRFIGTIASIEPLKKIREDLTMITVRLKFTKVISSSDSGSESFINLSFFNKHADKILKTAKVGDILRVKGHISERRVEGNSYYQPQLTAEEFWVIGGGKAIAKQSRPASSLVEDDLYKRAQASNGTF